MRSQRERLLDILGAIEEIEEYAGLGHDAYVQNKLIQGWMILHLQRIWRSSRSSSRQGSRAVPRYTVARHCWHEKYADTRVLRYKFYTCVDDGGQ